jgi:hypothetical protein
MSIIWRDRDSYEHDRLAKWAEFSYRAGWSAQAT